MEIVLVNPGGMKAGQESYQVAETAHYMYPYSLIYVQNYLTKKGIKSKLFDLHVEDVNKLIDYCKDLRSLIIGVTCQTYSSIKAVELIRKIKNQNQSAIIVVGGKHFTYCAEDALNKVQEIDFVVRGEGEITFYELVKTLENKDALEKVSGISFRKSNHIVHTEDREQIRDIEEVSLDYDKLPYQKHFAKGIYMRNFEKEKIKTLPLFLGRGCSQKCIFCLYNQFRYRVRKKEEILKDIRYLREKYGYDYFSFSDPSFCERKVFAKDFCETLIKERYNIKWSCEARVDTSLELLELMANAGCVGLDFALESGSERVLTAIRKRIKPQQALNFAKTCKSLGIRTHVFLMGSLPEETEEDAKKTIDLAEQLSKYCESMSFAILQIFPGTQLEHLARRKGILPLDFSYFDERFFHPYNDICDENVPIYMENFSIDFIRNYKKTMAQIKSSKYDTLPDLLKKVVFGIRRMPSRSFSRNIRDFLRFTKAIMGKIQNVLS